MADVESSSSVAAATPSDIPAEPAGAAATAAADGAEEAPVVSTIPTPTPTTATQELTTVPLKITFAGETQLLDFALERTVGELKERIAELTGCPASNQKLAYKGQLAAPGKPELDARTLQAARVKKKANILVIGATAAAAAEAEQAQADAKAGRIPKGGLSSAGTGTGTGSGSDADDKKWAEVTEHKRVLSRGKPDDVMFAYRPGQDPLPPTALSGLYLAGNRKVRVAVDAPQQSLVLSTKEAQQKIQLGRISSVTSQPIPGHEEYLMVCLKTGASSRSSIFLYWFPAQYFNSFEVGSFFFLF